MLSVLRGNRGVLQVWTTKIQVELCMSPGPKKFEDRRLTIRIALKVQPSLDTFRDRRLARGDIRNMAFILVSGNECGACEPE